MTHYLLWSALLLCGVGLYVVYRLASRLLDILERSYSRDIPVTVVRSDESVFVPSADHAKRVTEKANIRGWAKAGTETKP